MDSPGDGRRVSRFFALGRLMTREERHPDGDTDQRRSDRDDRRGARAGGLARGRLPGGAGGDVRTCPLPVREAAMSGQEATGDARLDAILARLQAKIERNEAQRAEPAETGPQIAPASAPDDPPRGTGGVDPSGLPATPAETRPDPILPVVQSVKRRPGAGGRTPGVRRDRRPKAGSAGGRATALTPGSGRPSRPPARARRPLRRPHHGPGPRRTLWPSGQASPVRVTPATGASICGALTPRTTRS